MNTPDASARHRSNAKVAIVSTHRNWTAESEAWARYHLALGFSKIYVFVDDGRAPSLPASLAVELTPCTDAYWLSHPPRPEFGNYLRDIERDLATPERGSPERVTQRQILNAATALGQAARDGLDWLLHIDDDEYFWCPEGSIHEHFRGLDAAGIAWAHYWNHEAVLLDEGVSPPARGRTVYRKNPHALTRVQRSAIPSVLPGKPYFTSHEGGKTAARVMPDTLPRGVHSFQFENPMLGESAFTVPAILHLPYKSAAHFCDKHLTQGIFSTEQLFGMQWTPPGVYAEAQHLCRGQDIEGLRALYSRAVTLTQAERDRLETHGYLLTTQAPLPFDADWAG